MVKKILCICNVIGYCISFWELFIERNYIFGSILSGISLLLTIILSIKEHKDKILGSILANNKNSGTILFFIITILYIICDGLLLWRIYSLNDTLTIYLFAFIIAPILYILFTCFFRELMHERVKDAIVFFPYYITFYALYKTESDQFAKVIGFIAVIFFLIIETLIVGFIDGILDG